MGVGLAWLRTMSVIGNCEHVKILRYHERQGGS